MIFRLLVTFLIVGTLAGCSYRPAPTSSVGSPSTTSSATSSTAPAVFTPPTEQEVTELDALAKTSLVRITTKKGTIDLELYPDDAPVTVANFVKLIRAGFYDGLTFHRVEKTPQPFVIQGGDPLGTGRGGPGYTIKAEFNAQKHETGTLAMARSSDPDSAGSQFYITLAPQPFLDGNYTVFGRVTVGFDVVQIIERGDHMDTVTVVSR